MTQPIQKYLPDNWLTRAALAGGLLALALIVIALPQHESSATSQCTGVTTFTTGMIPTAQMFNDNWTAPCSAILILDDGNISTTAGIQQSKLESLLNNTAFADHDARHEPGGADEMNDLDIANTGILVSAHASRHAPGGADPLNSVSRGQFITETALQEGLAVTAIVSSQFDSGVVATKQPIDLVHCNSRLYVLINDTAGGNTDTVVRLSPATMALAATISLSADDDPVDMECGRDGSVYVLTNGAASRKLKKISTADVVSTVKDLGTNLSVDNMVGMASDNNTVNIYIIGQDNTISSDRIIYRVVAATGATTSVLVGANNEQELMDLFVFSKNATDRVAVLHRDVTGGSGVCQIDTFTTAGPPVLDEEIVFEPVPPLNNNSCRSMEFDGSLTMIQGASGSAVGSTIVSMGQGARLGAARGFTWATAWPDGREPQYSFFGGDKLYFQTDTGTMNVVIPGASTVLTVNKAVQSQTVNEPCGIASDGTTVWVCTREALVHYYISRML